MNSPALRLYVDSGFMSPYAMSAFVALHEKGADVEIATVDLAAEENREPDYANLSLTRRVPTLIHGDFSLSESSAITEYVDEVLPGAPLYPVGARERARARQLQAWLRSDLMPLRAERSTEVVFRAPVATALSPEARRAADTLFAVADRLIASDDADIFGAWSIVDLDLAIMLSRLVRNDDPVPDKLAAWTRRQWARPSARRWIDLDRPG
ncbi:MAG: glutathione transferase [Lautropia sp.]